MYSKLLALLNKPEIYQGNEQPFWDDEHISKMMLEAHLNPELEVASRTAEFMDRSARWIAQIAPPSRFKRVLDLGCGPGLYAQRFYRMGYTVTGIDLSRRSIRYAKDQAHKEGMDICYVCGNYCQLDSKEMFDLVTLIYCDYGALCPSDRREVLRRAYASLRPGGRMILDVFSHAHAERFSAYQVWKHCPDGGFWRKGAHLMLEEGFLCPEHVIGRRIAVVTPEEESVYNLWDTCYTPQKLQEETQAAGFEVCGMYGDVAGAAYTEDCDTLAIVIEKR